MKVLLDTCVLYPTVMRALLLHVARAGLFTPLWSDRILEEWARAAKKLGPVGEAQAQTEITLVKVAWPKACVAPSDGLQARLWLPDPNDIHVLAAAVAGSADVLLTMNAKDFPRHILAEEGVSRADPDAFLLGLWEVNPDLVDAAAQALLAEANRLSQEGWTLRPLLKKARLPRLAKALAA
jgi:predicted nucleic acid-binding protein